MLDGSTDIIQAPITGRINLFKPFLHVTGIERAILVHKYFFKFAKEARKLIATQAKSKRLMGHCRVRLVNDNAVYCHLADRFYNKELGARSLSDAVKTVQEDFIFEYSNTDELVVEELNKDPPKTYYVKRVPVGNDAYKVVVLATIESAEEADAVMSDQEL